MFWGILRENWLFLLLLVLPLVSLVSTHTSLFTGFVFTFFVPGLIFYRFFRLESHEILVFVPVFSVLISTQLVYYLSLVFGYSRETILFSFLALAVVYGLVNSRKKAAYPLRNFLKVRQYSKSVLAIFLLISRLRKRKEAIPFGPFLAFGGIMSLFFKTEIIEWYFGMDLWRY